MFHAEQETGSMAQGHMAFKPMCVMMSQKTGVAMSCSCLPKLKRSSHRDFKSSSYSSSSGVGRQTFRALRMMARETQLESQAECPSKSAEGKGKDGAHASMATSGCTCMILYEDARRRIVLWFPDQPRFSQCIQKKTPGSALPGLWAGAKSETGQ